ncbi:MULTISPECIES: hypothetical protein [unclassified Burkholderia]|uniref:hypothetical protein n=1 Tax=unclassified Burkholderia TaxID=2613784 RepID=UPI000F5B0518|nr:MULTISPECIES: hypothetical protein [unclassified Burkholderia]
MTHARPRRSIRAFLEHPLAVGIACALIGSASTWIVNHEMARADEQRKAFDEAWGRAELFAEKQARYDDVAALDALAAEMPQNPVSALLRKHYRALGADAQRARDDARDALATRRLLLSKPQYDATYRFIETVSATNPAGRQNIPADLETLRATAKTLRDTDG